MQDLNLKPSIARFLASLTADDVFEIEFDQTTVSSIQSRSASAREELAKWLHTYRVLMGYTTAARMPICEEILSFAWEKERPSLLNGPDEVYRQFKALEQRLQSVAPARDGKPRGVTSLCSKALWCCFPEDVPIYDANARVALTVLTRVAGIEPIHRAPEYVQFLAKWFAVYDAFLAQVDVEEMRQRFGFTVRAFDRYLWFLGDPNDGPETIGNDSEAAIPTRWDDYRGWETVKTVTG